MCIGKTIFSEKHSPIKMNKGAKISSVFDDMRFNKFMVGVFGQKTTVDIRLQSDSGQSKMRISTQSDLMNEFMTVMSIAHEVVAQDPMKLSKTGEEDAIETEPSKLVYQGPSPDEVTLVDFARARGYTFIDSNDSVFRMRIDEPVVSSSPSSKTASAMTVANQFNDRDSGDMDSQGSDYFNFDRSNQNMRHKQAKPSKSGEIRFQVERRIEFNSTRKRMSILVKDPRDGYYKLYVKGADSEIQSRLKQGRQDVTILKEVNDFTLQAS